MQAIKAKYQANKEDWHEIGVLFAGFAVAIGGALLVVRAIKNAEAEYEQRELEERNRISAAISRGASVLPSDTGNYWIIEPKGW